MADRVIIHPNRDTAEAKSMRAGVILLLLTSALLIVVITVGGWSEEQGMQVVGLAFAIIYVVMAYYVAQWNRGLLPVASALGILVGVMATISAPAWFSRDKAGFRNPAFDPSILGLLSLILIPVSLLLIVFAMRAFQQGWNVEIEVDREEAERHGARAAAT